MQAAENPKPYPLSAVGIEDLAAAIVPGQEGGSFAFGLMAAARYLGMPQCWVAFGKTRWSTSAPQSCSGRQGQPAGRATASSAMSLL